MVIRFWFLMASSVAIDPVVTLCPPNHNWRIKVRVVRLWIADGFAGENKPASMELILLDQHVCVMFFYALFFFIVSIVIL